MFIYLLTHFFISTYSLNHNSSIELAYQYLESHLLTGHRWGYHYHTYRPSLTKYSATQWLWDSGAHMIIWSHRNVTNAILDLRTMLQMQHPNGFIPEQIYWGVNDTADEQSEWAMYGNIQQSNNTQMPVLAFSLRAIYQACSKLEDCDNQAILTEFLNPLILYWDWWWNTRAVGPHGLVAILHSWESGLDASPLYDLPYNITNPMPSYANEYPKFPKLMKLYHFQYHWNQTLIFKDNTTTHRNSNAPWIVEDIGVNAVYARGWGILAELSRLGGEMEKWRKCRQMEQTITRNILQHSWQPDSNQFISFYKNSTTDTWQPIYTKTIQGILPILLTDLPDHIVKQLVYGQITNSSHFWTYFPLPSVSISEPSFNPVFSIDLMWRGPTWGFTNWLVMEGLFHHGYHHIVMSILERWLTVVDSKGIYEMYNPLNGSTYGVEGLGMSCLFVDWIYRIKSMDIN